jgi:hypothetical protein
MRTTRTEVAQSLAAVAPEAEANLLTKAGEHVSVTENSAPRETRTPTEDSLHKALNLAPWVFVVSVVSRFAVRRATDSLRNRRSEVRILSGAL